MAKFLYEAASKEGLIVKGEFEAMTKADVIAHLEAKQLIPISVMGGGLQKGVRSSLDAALFERITPIDKIVMVRNLGAAVKAGLSIIETLDIMIADTNKRVVKSVLISAKSNLENGQPLYKTFESYGKIFPIIFVGMIKAGEASGGLDNALEELANHLTREYELTKKVKSALTYPIILLCAAIGVVALLLIFVLPRLTQTFSSSGIELPLITRLLISFSGFITSNWAVDSMVAAFLVWFFLFFRKRPAGRRFFTSVIMRIPIAKELLKKVALVRFTRTLASLILSGTSMLEALQLSADSVSNEAYKGAISESIKKVRSGVSISESFGLYPKLFPRFLVGLMAVGEKTGTLDTTLRTFSNFYDEEVDRNLKDLVALVEPMLILSMGLIVVVIAIPILLPIYHLAGGLV